MGAFRWLAHLLARILHGLARTLEGGRADPLDAATAALAQRFPGAPDHWLRYIAARAPHLAAARVETAPADREVRSDYAAPAKLVGHSIGADYPVPSRTRWWWPRRAAGGDTPLRLAESGGPAVAQDEPVMAPESLRDVTVKRPGSLPPVARRARLRIVGGKSAEPSRAEAPSAQDQSPPGAKAELNTSPRERMRRPGLRIATASARSRAELYLDQPPQKPHEPRFAERQNREPAPTPFTASQRDRTAPVLGDQPARPAAPAWWTGSPPGADSELVLPTHLTTAGKAGRIVSWGGEGRRRTAEHFPSSETGRDHWPDLLPPDPSDIDNAPAPMPDMARLRDEQDFGGWSG